MSKSTAWYIQETSAVRAMPHKQKWSRTSVREEWRVGPTKEVSLRESPIEEGADTLNTARIFIVLLDLYAQCAEVDRILHSLASLVLPVSVGSTRLSQQTAHWTDHWSGETSQIIGNFSLLGTMIYQVEEHDTSLVEEQQSDHHLYRSNNAWSAQQLCVLLWRNWNNHLVSFLPPRSTGKSCLQWQQWRGEWQ